MLLCCFREPKKSKRRDSLDDEDSVVIRAPPPQNGSGGGKRCGVGQRASLTHSVSAIDGGTIGVGSRRSSTSSGCRAPPLRDGAARREKERAPLMKDEKRMFKQRSHIERRTSSSSTSTHGGGNLAAGGGNLPYIDQSPVKVAAPATEEMLQTEQMSGRMKERDVFFIECWTRFES